MGNDAISTDPAADVDFGAIQRSETFGTLKRKHRNFVFPVLVACLLWYFAYVLLAAYAKDFMSTPVFGSINMGLLLGLAQVATTFIVTMWYVRYANRELDPIAAEIRDEIEAGKEIK